MLNKLLSGRYFLTVICGLAFCYAMIKQTLPAEAIVSIITMVFISYFQRSDRKPNGGV